jgi:hypothetical protein
MDTWVWPELALWQTSAQKLWAKRPSLQALALFGLALGTWGDEPCSQGTQDKVTFLDSLSQFFLLLKMFQYLKYLISCWGLGLTCYSPGAVWCLLYCVWLVYGQRRAVVRISADNEHGTIQRRRAANTCLYSKNKTKTCKVQKERNIDRACSLNITKCLPNALCSRQ